MTAILTNTEKMICREVLNTCDRIVERKEFTVDGKAIVQTIVESDGEEYLITKENGEFTYFHHVIR